MQISFSALKKRVGWVAGLVLLWLLAIPARAEDRYVLPGSKVTSWDTFAHTWNTNLSTFPDNCGSVAGMTRLKNGHIACLFNIGFVVPPPRGLILYVFEINPTNNPPWRVVDGPHWIDFVVPGWLWGGLGGGITEFTQGRLLLNAGGAFPVPGDDEHIFYKTYWLTLDNPASQPVLYREFTVTEGVNVPGGGEMAYLPSDGRGPDCIVVPTARDYQVFDTGGAYIRTISGQSLGLSYQLGQNNQHGSLEATDDGDLLASDDDDTAGIMTGYISWDHVICVRFDRYGKLKGSWGLGATIMDEDPYNGFPCLAQLSNGDIYTSSMFALYKLTEPGYGDRNIHTYRHYILRPPASFSQPVLQLSTTNLDLGWKAINYTHTATVRLSNPGSAPLKISSMTLTGDTNVFQFAPLKSTTLDPGYSRFDITNTYQDCTLAFHTSKLGSYQAKLTVVSSDPVNPTQTVALAVSAVPVRFSLPPLLATTNVWSKPTHPTGMCLSADGESLLLMLAVWADDGIMRGRIAQMPLLRDAAGRITGLNTNAITNLCDVSQYSTHALRQGSDGTLWYGPMNPYHPYLFQRSPDGVVTTHTLTNADLGGPVDLMYAPGQSALIVARASGYHLQMFNLQPTNGTVTPVFQGDVASSLPIYLRSFDMWVEGASLYLLLYQVNGQLWLIKTAADAMQGGSSGQVESALISDRLSIQALVRDPRSGDILVLDNYGQIRRLSGYLDFLHAVTLTSTVIGSGKVTFRWEAESGKTYRIQFKAKLTDEAWQDVREFKASSEAAEFSEAISSAHEGYYRVIMIP